MLSIGLTGGVASGKSTAARMLAKRGAAVIEADKIAREAMAPGSSVFKDIIGHFGPDIIDNAGDIDRTRLAEIIFTNEDERLFLNNLTHPLVTENIKKSLSMPPPGKSLFVVEVPLLVEAGMADLFDKIVVVAATPELQVSRLEVQGLSRERALRRLRAQISDAERYNYADFIILNKGSLANLAAQVDNLMKKLLNENK